MLAFTPASRSSCSTSTHFLSCPTLGPPMGMGNLLLPRFFVILRPATKNLGRSRFPIPIGGPKVGHDKKWVEVEQELREAGVKASIVAPHNSVQGLLYFDLRSQFDLLNSSRLYVPDVVALEKNRELLYFEIDLSQAGAQ